jgi:hypothetical protein
VVFINRASPAAARVIIEVDRSKKPARGTLLQVLEPTRSVDAPCFGVHGNRWWLRSMHLSRAAQLIRLAISTRSSAISPSAEWHDLTRAGPHAPSCTSNHWSRSCRLYSLLNLSSTSVSCGALDPALLQRSTTCA